MTRNVKFYVKLISRYFSSIFTPGYRILWFDLFSSESNSTYSELKLKSQQKGLVHGQL